MMRFVRIKVGVPGIQEDKSESDIIREALEQCRASLAGACVLRGEPDIFELLPVDRPPVKPNYNVAQDLA